MSIQPSILARPAPNTIYLGEWTQDGTNDRGTLHVEISEELGDARGMVRIVNQPQCALPFPIKARSSEKDRIIFESTGHIVCGFIGGQMRITAQEGLPDTYLGTYEFRIPMFSFSVTSGSFTATKKRD